MRVILLSAGFGSRLRPLTLKIPKCLVPINGVPLLQIWLERLDKYNLGPILVNTHYLKEHVEDFVNSSPLMHKVLLVYEPILLGTGGTLMSNIDFFKGEDGLLIHADNFCLADLGAFIDAHNNRHSGCLLTMMTFRTEMPKTCGIIEIDNDDIVKAMHEKVDHPPGNLANGAIYILSKELITFLKNTEKPIFDFSLDVLPMLMGRIYTYETSKTFMDIGNKYSYEKANKNLF